MKSLPVRQFKPPEERAAQLASVLPERNRGGPVVLLVDSLLETDSQSLWGQRPINEDIKYHVNGAVACTLLTKGFSASQAFDNVDEFFVLDGEATLLVDRPRR